MVLIVANIFGLISALILIYMGSIKEKNTVLKYQIVQTSFGSLCDLLLGGIPSVITNIFNIIRNVLVTKNRFNKIYMFILIVLTTALVLYFNNLGYIGLIPLANFIFYTIFINTDDNIIFKYVFIISMITWLIYDFIIKAYSSSFFDFITIIIAIITVIRMIKSASKKKKKD